MEKFLISRKVPDVEQQPSRSGEESHNSHDDQATRQKLACLNRKLSVPKPDSSETDENVAEKSSDNEDISSDTSSSKRSAPASNKKKKRKKDESRTVKKAKRLFRAVWLCDFSWVTSRNNKPFCTACQKSLDGGQTHLQRYEKTDMHQKRIVATSRTITLDVMTKENLCPKTATEVKSSALKLRMLIAEHNLPFKLLEHLPKLLTSLCPDSEIAKPIACSRRKGRNIIVDIMRPQSLHEAASKLRTAKFSLIIDETTDISTSKCLAVVARYFDNDTKEIRDRCLGLLEVPCCTAAALHSAVTEFLTLHNIPLQNIIGFAADNASVMMGNFNGVQAKFKEELPNLFVMGCVTPFTSVHPQPV